MTRDDPPGRHRGEIVGISPYLKNLYPGLGYRLKTPWLQPLKVEELLLWMCSFVEGRFRMYNMKISSIVKIHQTPVGCNKLIVVIFESASA